MKAAETRTKEFLETLLYHPPSPPKEPRRHESLLGQLMLFADTKQRELDSKREVARRERVNRICERVPKTTTAAKLFDYQEASRLARNSHANPPKTTIMAATRQQAQRSQAWLRTTVAEGSKDIPPTESNV